MAKNISEKSPEEMSYLELVEFYMDAYGYDEELACRLADMDKNPEYNADDYDAE